MDHAAGRGTGWSVAEVLGVDGPFSFPEKLLQRIWLRSEYDGRGALTTDGRRVVVEFPGRWNLLGGPDFREARLVMEGVALHGDVEVHLRAADWRAHGHAGDPAYARVVLHVVLFPTEERFTRGVGGVEIPILPLLPLLHHDLEEYAAEAAVAALANRPDLRIVEALGGLAPEARQRLLAGHAEERWRQKVRFARLRVERLGWDEACHQTALEILGYRFNRVPMLKVAAGHPLARWHAPDFDVEAVYASVTDWQRQGVRPANRPVARLRQYARWVSARPHWPDRLDSVMNPLPAIAAPPGSRTGAIRRDLGFRRRREDWRAALCGQAVGGPRFDTLLCDGLLPLAAASGRVEERAACAWWGHWFEGDLPAGLHAGLRDLAEIGGDPAPACQGLAQGLLGWLLAEERKA